MTTPEQPMSATPVTEANFNRAESDLYFGKSLSEGARGTFHHFREVMPVENQRVARANRDTLYSSGVFDLSAGPVTITLPPTAGRFMSLTAIDEDRHAVQTVYAPGRFTFDKDKIGTRYLMLGIRTFVDPNDARDVAKAHALQNAVKVEQKSVAPFDLPPWDGISRGKVHDELMCLTVIPAKNDGKTIHTLTVKNDVPVDGFWSISVYGPEGYFEKNDRNLYSINSVNAKKAADGSVTIQFGGCEKKASNCIPIMPGWNYWVRFYRPRKALIEGTYKFPPAIAVG